jgi:hypothetical protein
MNLSDFPHAEQVAAILTASPEAIRSAWATHNGRKGGAPRKDVPRCPCGRNTELRAMARRFDCCKAAGVR